MKVIIHRGSKVKDDDVEVSNANRMIQSIQQEANRIQKLRAGGPVLTMAEGAAADVKRVIDLANQALRYLDSIG